MGLFVIIGVLLLGWMIVHLGELGGKPRGGYPIYVEVSDATGIRSGVPVNLGGVEIGYVASEPSLSDDFTTLSIELKIYEGRKIPMGSDVKVGTSGLMGDSFIRITPPKERASEFFGEGDRIVAASAGNIGDLAGSADETLEKASEVLESVDATIGELNQMFKTMEENVLHEENVENINVLLKSLRASSEYIEAAAAKLNPLLAKSEEAADEAMTAAHEVKGAAEGANQAILQIQEGMDNFSNTLDSVDPVIADLDATIDEFRKTLTQANRIVDKLDHGNGLASALLNDSSLREDLTSFADKLNQRGVLFYPKDNTNSERASPRSSSPPPSPGQKPSEKRGPFSWLKKKDP